ncbi:MAG TPA: ATPase, T2SS/T4P/T4SS family, partial [Candidatus Tumulicola sp.]
SGKTTTLYAALSRINGVERNIITVEDPIEYEIVSRESFVTQREIGCDAPSLEAALIGALRADPDVLVVGEVRDAKSMRAVLTAAETGHLVLATLHTGTASETVERVTDMFDGPMQARARIALAETLIAVVCQRLVKRPNAGRRAVVEMLVATPAVRSIIRQSKTHLLRNTIATGRQHGMQTFAQHAQELLACGEISAAVAARFIESSMAAA